MTIQDTSGGQNADSATTEAGVALLKEGRLDEAVACLREALAATPGNVRALNHLGQALHKQGRRDDAAACFERVLSLRPDHVSACVSLGNVRTDQQRFTEALACYERALTLKPDISGIHYNCGLALQALDRSAEAAAKFRQAIAANPNYAPAHNSLGTALRNSDKLEEALVAYRRALAMQPDFADAHCNLAMVWQKQGKLQEAVTSYEQALSLLPDSAYAHGLLAVALKDQGHLDEAMRHFARALELDPWLTETHNSLLFSMNYVSDLQPEAAHAAHAEFGNRHEAPHREAAALPHANIPDTERRLRIGYVSGDFRYHSVASFLEPVLAQHDRARFEVYCYSCSSAADDMTRRLQGYADHWRNIAGMSDEEAAQCIREDRIDILIDLAGHTANNRLLTFARKPAPVQVAYLGYPNTTGLTTMDYRLTDAQADPEGCTEHLFTERLIRLPRVFLCYRPSEGAPPLVAPPVVETGRITFGSFNALSKITPEVVACWSRILRALPKARLILKNSSLRDEATCRRYLDLFSREGIAPGRLDLLSWTASASEHLVLYWRVDIALDPFPYNGTTTTCEALWMGVPVITLAGRTHAGRVGVSLLNSVGLDDLVADSPDRYVELAVQLARQPERLTSLRRELRECMAASPLCDAPVFARDLEAAYRTMWQQWCTQQSTTGGGSP